MNKKANFKIKKTLSIGSPDAETDDILFDVFVKTENLEQILDTTNQKSILFGRTGSGKSAIIRYLKKCCDKHIEISPESMSLKFLSNSTILNHFKQLNVNLNLFYKVLWKHVFIVELLKLYFKDDNKYNISSNLFFINIIENIKSKINKNPKRERAIKYLEQWSNDFWKETEYRIKSFEEKIIEDYKLEMGINLEILSAKIRAGNNSEQTYLYEAKSKAENIIYKSQSTELIEIFGIMKEEFFINHQKKFYIIIDDLDKEWIEDSFRYELIGAMIETVKEFRQLKGVKIVIALRENLSDIVLSGLQNKGGQRDKLKPLYLNLDWSKEDLKIFLDNRLKNISDNQLDINKAFYKSRRGNKSGFEYVIERTYKRPRDIISFINLAIEDSNNKNSFTKDIIYKVESLYSLHRFQSLEDEWSENYGHFSNITLFLNGIHNGFRLKSINENSFESVYLEEDPDIIFRNDLKKAIDDWRVDNIKFIVFLKKVLLILFRIGIIGVKKGPNYPVVFYYDYDVLINKNDISTNSKFYVHPALYSYFKVNVLDQLPENDNET